MGAYLDDGVAGRVDVGERAGAAYVVDVAVGRVLLGKSDSVSSAAPIAATEPGGPSHSRRSARRTSTHRTAAREHVEREGQCCTTGRGQAGNEACSLQSLSPRGRW